MTPTTPSGDARRGGAAGADQALEPFEALFRAEFRTMFRLAHLLGAADPEDIAQEAFARLHTRWPSLSDPARAGGYLRTTVVNLCRSAARHEAVEARYDAAQPVQRAESSAEDAALQSVSDRSLLAALGALAPRHREALVLRFWLDLSEAQMAEAMACSAGSVKSHVSRGLKALRAALKDIPEGQR
ncbi:MAG: hypothetical protein BGO26_14805 [Actinobacteria bacterium 69-20]|nr:sigma-70 family RNA polymerase sigma factor [Actinomycetota bacterium]OJV29572.1 MAG: hypothetical protein BGO26_14805 [Actinobacteria bacterium 69-20]